MNVELKSLKNKNKTQGDGFTVGLRPLSGGTSGCGAAVTFDTENITFTQTLRVSLTQIQKRAFTSYKQHRLCTSVSMATVNTDYSLSPTAPVAADF